MKNKKLKIALASIVSFIVLCGIAGYIFAFYYLNNMDYKALWIPLILGTFLFDITCALILFSQKCYSDEHKAFWLFIILVIPVIGSIFWLFIGRNKQKGFGQGKSNQVTILSHLFKAQKSIKIYTNSLFLSNDTIKAINYAIWKDVKVDIVLSFEQKKWKQKVTKYNISRFYETKVNIYFSNKQIEHNFILIDDKEVLFSDQNFNHKNMFNDSKLYLAEDVNAYISLWNRDFIRTSIYKHKQTKQPWYRRFRYGLINIFYLFY